MLERMALKGASIVSGSSHKSMAFFVVEPKDDVRRTASSKPSPTPHPLEQVHSVAVGAKSANVDETVGLLHGEQPLTRVRLGVIGRNNIIETPHPLEQVVHSVAEKSTDLDETVGLLLHGEQLLTRIRSGVIGRNSVIDTPFGSRPLVYADYTASGRSLKCIEDFIQKDVMPQYANTHTTTSITGLQSTCFREEARQIIAQCVNADDDEDLVLFTGSGSTSAIHKLVQALGLHVRRPKSRQMKPVVFVGPFEHHSNILPWRESDADVVQIAETADGAVDLAMLELELVKHKNRPMRIGSFSAASNLTGVLTDVDAITCMLHQHGALSFWDYAAAAPYVPLDMNPKRNVDEALQPFVYKDAIFLSGHKFLGGPGTPGVLVVKKRLIGDVPTVPGGGTVFYVTTEDHRYVSSAEAREEGGTPDTLGSIRLGLAFQIKQRIGHETILDIEHRHVQRVISRLQNHSHIVLLGHATVTRLPIFSFLIRAGSRFLHYNFVCALLNDVFGIQSRGGCQCAGPYGSRLLGLTSSDHDALKAALKDESKLLRPGMSRVSFPYAMDDTEVDYVLAAMDFVATEGWKFLPQYEFNHASGEWKHRTRVTTFPTRKWLIKAAFFTEKNAGPDVPASPLATYNEYLDQAHILADQALADACCGPEFQMEATKEALRWFVYPSEVQVANNYQHQSFPLKTRNHTGDFYTTNLSDTAAPAPLNRNDYELVIKCAKELEYILEAEFGATGKGLHEKISAVNGQLPPQLVKQMRFLATIRNKLIHERGFDRIPDRDHFILQFEAAAGNLNERVRARGGASSNCILM
ncbi:hypothetical protein DYB26_003750 [Aphanomyces astaci]|uniref:Aminotransferase class V domain-containing protein n=1 Tax=Aphanomyces astaci TaxID=112090 RepID=A0A418FUZ5_APHAT|nr:hypothetical protein DYB26_003750 [Aphanomyces astaci]